MKTMPFLTMPTADHREALVVGRPWPLPKEKVSIRLEGQTGSFEIKASAYAIVLNRYGFVTQVEDLPPFTQQWVQDQRQNCLELGKNDSCLTTMQWPIATLLDGERSSRHLIVGLPIVLLSPFLPHEAVGRRQMIILGRRQPEAPSER
jgi:hypothetical protein